MPERVEETQAGLTYLIEGEKEPYEPMEQTPWVDRAEDLMMLVGGAVRHDNPEIIPILYVSMGFTGEQHKMEFSSDQVPLSEDDNGTVRVICGQFKNVVHSVPVPKDVTVLDITLAQGGVFDWKVLSDCKAFIYVVSGKVQIENQESLANCQTDTLVWVHGKKVHLSAMCSGGRVLLVVLPKEQEKNRQGSYVQEILPALDYIK